MTILETYLLGGALLLILSVFSSKAIGKFGIPSLLVFLGIGMLAGREGIGKIYFDDAHFSQGMGVIALQFILFAGGLETDWKRVKPIVAPSILLATVGVLVTCGITGLFATSFFNFSIVEALLLGAIVSSTDAAAVFTILRGRGVGLKGDVREILEVESGGNDPMAVFLTTGFVTLLTQAHVSPVSLIPSFFLQMLYGAMIGLGVGKLVSHLFSQVKLEFEGLYPVLMIAVVLATYSVTQLIGGSGFLAVYLAGLVVGHQNFLHKKSLVLFHNGIAWLMQIMMFLTMGLLVLPSQVIKISAVGLVLSALLILVARPVSVYLSLAFSKITFREKSMIAWTGLRGAVPIILATFPLVAGIPKADDIFNIVFFIVITSVLLQGTSIPMVAKFLKVDAPVKIKFQYPLEYVPTGDLKSDLVELHVAKSSKYVGRTILDLRLPKEVLVVLIRREGKILVPKGGTRIEAGDAMLVLAESDNVESLRKLVA